jgi:hypothetical protein
MENKDQENIQKLIDLEVEKRLKERGDQDKEISFDEFIAITSKTGGMPEWKLREAFRAWTETIINLSVEERKQFFEDLKLRTGIEFKILEEDS